MDTKETISKAVNIEQDKLNTRIAELEQTIRTLKHENNMLSNKIKAMKGEKGLVKIPWIRRVYEYFI